MTRLVVRALTAAVGGAVAAAVSLTAAFNAHPDLTFEMDRDLPRAASGFYPIERVARDTFAWTTARAELVFPRFDRAAAWRCSVSVRGGRPPGFRYGFQELWMLSPTPLRQPLLDTKWTLRRF